ncbi:TapB family protein [Bradyrhizobium neotropicale]|uniref:DUF3108 domain-containing protein n=1 Tax=Bradyrhizobium neotropicale TaxID=1497615 RepID=A0A176Z9M0_9BRAD|nr:hypothetical protein [Bradyrhizobium neotropicale]OAF17339.1 hypothetical protein AXW67_09110 [Bradyrhizobium neotropicale]
MLRRCLLATIGLLACASVVAAQTPASQPPADASTETPEQQEPRTGDRWTYEVRDEITGELKSTVTQTITDVSPAEIGIRLTFLGKPGIGFQTFDHSWNSINTGTWKFTPNDGTGIKTPLEVGKSWSVRSTDFNSGSGASLKRSVTSKVTAKESITTRAGTFETYKIETSIDMQNANDPTKKFQSSQQTWYAPTVDHWVKRTWVSKSEGRVSDKGSVELIEYGRR